MFLILELSNVLCKMIIQNYLLALSSQYNFQLRCLEAIYLFPIHLYQYLSVSIPIIEGFKQVRSDSELETNCKKKYLRFAVYSS